MCEAPEVRTVISLQWRLWKTVRPSCGVIYIPGPHVPLRILEPLSLLPLKFPRCVSQGGTSLKFCFNLLSIDATCTYLRRVRNLIGTLYVIIHNASLCVIWCRISALEASWASRTPRMCQEHFKEYLFIREVCCSPEYLKGQLLKGPFII